MTPPTTKDKFQFKDLITEYGTSFFTNYIYFQEMVNLIKLYDKPSKDMILIDQYPGSGLYGFLEKALFKKSRFISTLALTSDKCTEDYYKHIYDTIFTNKTLDQLDDFYVILYLGDVIEHQSPNDAIDLIKTSAGYCDKLIITTPAFPYYQRSKNGNKDYSTHLSFWNPTSLIKLSSMYAITEDGMGVYSINSEMINNYNLLEYKESTESLLSLKHKYSNDIVSNNITMSSKTVMHQEFLSLLFSQLHI